MILLSSYASEKLGNSVGFLKLGNSVGFLKLGDSVRFKLYEVITFLIRSLRGAAKVLITLNGFSIVYSVFSVCGTWLHFFPQNIIRFIVSRPQLLSFLSPVVILTEYGIYGFQRDLVKILSMFLGVITLTIMGSNETWSFYILLGFLLQLTEFYHCQWPLLCG